METFPDRYYSIEYWDPTIGNTSGVDKVAEISWLQAPGKGLETMREIEEEVQRRATLQQVRIRIEAEATTSAAKRFALKLDRQGYQFGPSLVYSGVNVRYKDISP